MHMLAGTLALNGGRITIGDTVEDNYSVIRAQQRGIRCVFQELSLCPNLSVGGEHPHLPPFAPRLRLAAQGGPTDHRQAR